MSMGFYSKCNKILQFNAGIYISKIIWHNWHNSKKKVIKLIKIIIIYISIFHLFNNTQRDPKHFFCCDIN